MQKEICKTFYCLKISGNLRLLDYYSSCAPDDDDDDEKLREWEW